MSLRGLSLLQWAGVLVPPSVWAVQHVLGFYLGTAKCGDGRVSRAFASGAWELALLACAALLVVAAEAAAIVVLRATRGEDPEHSRLHFFATAAVVANVLFLVIILMDGFASGLETGCVGS